MLYLITGANGAGKTLNTLKWVRERSVKENRPVAHNGRFEAVEGGELSSWKAIDFQKWQDEPDGTIFLVDECHNDLPLRPPSGNPPEYVRMLAEHRRRGFDFYLITQHPQNVDAFVRRLIGSPGWHRHLKRNFGGDLVSVLEWPAVNAQCEKNGSGKSGTVTMQAFPKEVYGWYRSASLHTGKKKIPRAVFVLAACVVAIPLMLYFAATKVHDTIIKPTALVEKKPAAQALRAVESAAMPVKAGALTVEQYLQARVPRFADFPHTAEAYDEVTRPALAPYPAACVQMGERCDCYTQQATLLHVAMATCQQIVKFGFFVDWERPQAGQSGQRAPEAVTAAAPQVVQARTVPVPEISDRSAEIGLRDVPEVVRQGTRTQWAQELARRNDSIRSQILR